MPALRLVARFAGTSQRVAGFKLCPPTPRAERAGMSGIPPVYAGFGAAEDGPNDVPIKEQPSSLHRRSQSRGLIDGVDVVLAEPSLGGHRRTHSQGLIVDTHEGETVRTGSTSNMGLKKDDNHSPGLGAAAHFVSAEKEKGQTEKEQCWERIKQRYPNYDHYCPSTQGWSIFMTGFALIFSAIVALFVVLDQYVVPGFRMVPIGLLLYYVVYNGVRLLVVVEWTISRTTRRGLQFQPRMGVPQTRAALVAKLRERLQRSMASRPPLTRKPKIIVSIGFGGGGHEATVKGVMDVMTEAGFSTEIVEIPVGFLVETDDKNPVWNLTGCTGEQIYNWGLKKSEWVAFCIMWLLSLAQAAALTLDKFAGFFGQLINADYGDEAARVCERVWREHNPDMVLIVSYRCILIHIHVQMRVVCMCMCMCMCARVCYIVKMLVHIPTVGSHGCMFSICMCMRASCVNRCSTSARA